MKKISNVLLAALFIFLISAPQVMALEIQILPNGGMIFYQGSVLGDDDGSEKGKEDEHEDELDDKDSDEGENDIDDNEDQEENKQIIKVTSPQERKEIRFKAENDQVKVELREKQTHDGTRFERKEEIKTDQLEAEFETRQKVNEEIRERIKQEDENVREELKSYREKLRQERQERAEELTEINNKNQAGQNFLELLSRDVSARLEEGASFNLDPATNEVTVITPSGEEHVLYHLPDQAISQMQAAGLLSDGTEADELEVELETLDDGTVIYKARTKKNKRFLGLFSREIPTEVTLDDDTGEVAETAVEDRALLEKLLDTLSF